MSAINYGGLMLSADAVDNVRETGTVPADDVRRVREGLSAAVLLAECLNGADDDRVTGWRDYVDAVVTAAEVAS